MIFCPYKEWINYPIANIRYQINYIFINLAKLETNLKDIWVHMNETIKPVNEHDLMVEKH